MVVSGGGGSELGWQQAAGPSPFPDPSIYLGNSPSILEISIDWEKTWMSPLSISCSLSFSPPLHNPSINSGEQEEKS